MLVFIIKSNKRWIKRFKPIACSIRVKIFSSTMFLTSPSFNANIFTNVVEKDKITSNRFHDFSQKKQFVQAMMPQCKIMILPLSLDLFEFRKHISHKTWPQSKYMWQKDIRHAKQKRREKKFFQYLAYLFDFLKWIWFELFTYFSVMILIFFFNLRMYVANLFLKNTFSQNSEIMCSTIFFDVNIIIVNVFYEYSKLFIVIIFQYIFDETFTNDENDEFWKSIIWAFFAKKFWPQNTIQRSDLFKKIQNFYSIHFFSIID